MVESRLTTIDNHFDPFTQFREWYDWDIQHGYSTVERVAKVSKSLDIDKDEAIKMLIATDFMDIYRRVTREVPDISEEDDESGEYDFY